MKGDEVSALTEEEALHLLPVKVDAVDAKAALSKARDTAFCEFSSDIEAERSRCAHLKLHSGAATDTGE